MKDPPRLAELLTEFFRYTEREFEEVEHVIDEFNERVPNGAEGRARKIAHTYKPDAMTRLDRTVFAKELELFFQFICVQ